MAFENLTVDHVRGMFALANEVYLVEELGLGWSGQRFNLSENRLGNHDGIIALELWCGRETEVGPERVMWCWAIYVGAKGQKNNATKALLAHAAINNRLLGNGRTASVYELAPLPHQANATNEDIAWAAKVALERIRPLIDSANGHAGSLLVGSHAD
jgi:hypothetical protein